MSVPSRGRVVIVGAGPAGAAAAVALRGLGHEGDIVLIGEEPAAPYSRPPLSKAFLHGDVARSDLTLSTADAQVRTGVRAMRADFDARLVHLSDDDALPYDGLVLAMGMRARRPEVTGVEVLATIADAERIARRLPEASTAVVVGSGFLAYELASAAHARGAAVTLVHRPGALAARYGPLAEMLTARARAAGVRIVESAGRFADGAVVTADGVRHDADLVLAAIGADHEASISPAPAVSGLIVDDRCRLRDDVVVAGDQAVIRDPDGRLRHDHTWTNALAQGAAAARALIHDDAPAYAPVPYGWTEAFGLELKIAGAPPIGVTPVVIDGALDDKRALLQWPGGAAAVGYRIPIGRLRALAAAPMPVPATLDA